MKTKRHKWKPQANGFKCEHCEMKQTMKMVKLARANRYGAKTAYKAFYIARGGEPQQLDKTPPCPGSAKAPIKAKAAKATNEVRRTRKKTAKKAA